ncbi:hypothetical protein [Brevundimonas sp.]|uniref:hypothetical protein n=1 Tax=Brevundimonas sp. TaxID=1871086 RepID=UPI0035B4A745
MAAVAAGLVVGWFAFRPAMEVEGGLPWDKANHASAFLVLTVVTGLGWPRLSRLWLVALMLLAGVAVELIQGLDVVGRDADAMDVVADGVGILAGLAILRVQGIRGSRAA